MPTKTQSPSLLEDLRVLADLYRGFFGLMGRRIQHSREGREAGVDPILLVMQEDAEREATQRPAQLPQG